MFNIHIIKEKEVKPCSEFVCIAFSQCVMTDFFFSKCEESFVLLGVKLFKFEAEQNYLPNRTCLVCLFTTQNQEKKLFINSDLCKI